MCEMSLESNMTVCLTQCKMGFNLCYSSLCQRKKNSTFCFIYVIVMLLGILRSCQFYSFSIDYQNYLGFVKVGGPVCSQSLPLTVSNQCFIPNHKLHCITYLIQQSLTNRVRRTGESAANGPNWMGDYPLHP